MASKRFSSPVFFDFCNTLVDSKNVDHRVINEVLAAFNKSSWADMKKRKVPEKSMQENFPNFFGNQAREAYLLYMELLLSHKSNIHFFPYALQLVNLLIDNHCKVCVLSNRDREFIEQVSNGKLSSDVKIYTYEDTGCTKPNPQFIDRVIAFENIKDRKNIHMVGDARADVELARRCNLIPVWISAQKTDMYETNNLKDVLHFKKHQDMYRHFKEKMHNLTGTS